MITLNITILEVMRHIRNFFFFDKIRGLPHYQTKVDASNSNGSIYLPNTFKAGDWVAITGSRQLDGIYKLISEENEDSQSYFQLSNGTDEIPISIPFQMGNFTITLLLPNAGFISLCKEINDYVNNPENCTSSKTSESVIGLHSWSRATDSSGKPQTVFQIFGTRLALFRQMFTSFEI